MENIITELDHINTYINNIDDNDKDIINNEIKVHIDNINEILINIKNILQKYNSTDNLLENIKLKEKRDDLILKELFICYWFIKEKINAMNVQEILDYDNLFV